MLISVVFLLPVDSGDKMSVSVTNFLTLAVFMTLVQDRLPHSSDTVCYLEIYLASQIVLSGLAVVLSAAHRGLEFHDATSTRPKEATESSTLCWAARRDATCVKKGRPRTAR